MHKVKKSSVALLLSGFLCVCLIYILLYFLLLSCKPKKHTPRKFGATYMTMDNPYFDILNSAIEEVVESNGDILITRDPLQKQDKQNMQILDMLEMGVDFIFINPVDLEGITPVLKICHDKNVPFIVVDTNIAERDLAVSVIQSDNYDAGRQIGFDACQKCDAMKIVALYDKGILSTSSRFKGFLDALNENMADYQIVYTVTDTTLFQPSMAGMQQFLEYNTDFNVVFGGNDPASLGALAAIQKKHLDRRILIYGIDGSPDGKGMVEQGLMEGTVAQYPKIMGQKAAKLAYQFLDNNDVEHDVVLPVTLITQKNISDFEVLGWQ